MGDLHWSVDEIRRTFLAYFQARDHRQVASSSLVPAQDKTLLFTNSGMVQFKNTFLGLEARSYQRAVTSQRCVRAGGKHNDLENVGYTARHHTFFEMLGNFSFGDYFKRDAILYAWECLTEQFGIDPERLWVTVYHDDDEAYTLWRQEIGLSADRVIRIDTQDNFWQMGDTGPCGPCSEIFYDHGPAVAGGLPGTADADGDRYVEVWNLVFMQYNRDAAGKLHELPHPSVDTGMGLERIASVLQGVQNNYDIDLFRTLVSDAANILQADDPTSHALRVIADHIRSSAFLIVDGVMPSNEGRGYVLRRIIRRAVRHGHTLGATAPFFHRLLPSLINCMGAAYPELVSARERVAQALLSEEVSFFQTLQKGMALLESELARTRNTIAGEVAFKLYDTYGFPLDLTIDIARERGVEVDSDGFEQHMAQQRASSRVSGGFSQAVQVLDTPSEETAFVGYDALQTSAQVLAIYVEQQQVEALDAGQSGLVVLNRSAFYPESGGQIGDTGSLFAQDMSFEVADTQKQGGVILHRGTQRAGRLAVDMPVDMAVDSARRRAIACNHSATHMLHAALRACLGTHVEQRGSSVTGEYLRFDFSHDAPVHENQLSEVSDLVNQWIRDNHTRVVEEMQLEQALERGAIALFGENYGDSVRTVRFGDVSMELCGGTHVERSGDIGFFRILAESGISSGVRRVSALTGQAAEHSVSEDACILKEVAQSLGAPKAALKDKLDSFLSKHRELEAQIKTLNDKFVTQLNNQLQEAVITVGGVQVLAAQLSGEADAKLVSRLAAQWCDKLAPAVVLLGSVVAGRVFLSAQVSKQLNNTIQANALLNHLTEILASKGGGRADVAQAVGQNTSQLPIALQAARRWVEQHLPAQAAADVTS